MIAPNLLIIGDIFPFERSHDAMLYTFIYQMMQSNFQRQEIKIVGFDTNLLDKFCVVKIDVANLTSFEPILLYICNCEV